MNSTRETKFSGANGDREIFIFPVQLIASRIGNLTRLIQTLSICVTIHTYTDQGGSFKQKKRVVFNAFDFYFQAQQQNNSSGCTRILKPHVCAPRALRSPGGTACGLSTCGGCFLHMCSSSYRDRDWPDRSDLHHVWAFLSFCITHIWPLHTNNSGCGKRETHKKLIHCET